MLQRCWKENSKKSFCIKVNLLLLKSSHFKLTSSSELEHIIFAENTSKQYFCLMKLHENKGIAHLETDQSYWRFY